MTAYLTSHALALAAVLAWLLMLARRSGSRRTPQSTFAWLLAFAFVPIAAIPLYLALGSRKFPRRAKGRQLVVPPVRAGCSFELLATGEVAFARLIALIEKRSGRSAITSWKRRVSSAVSGDRLRLLRDSRRRAHR